MPFETENLNEIRANESARFEEIKKNNPEKLKLADPPSPDQILEATGVFGLGDLPKGYIRLCMNDFIVEEVGLKGEIRDIEASSSEPTKETEGNTIYADLVKIGLGTIEAITSIANALQMRVEKIGYAGMKDGKAITSQKISIREVDMEKVKTLSLPQLFLKNLVQGKGAMAPGVLEGNRFTILVRTETEPDVDFLEKKIAEIESDGFPNFYGVQRFGTRLLNVEMARFLCRGELESAVKTFLLESGMREMPLFTEIRQKAKASYGNWKEMLNIYSEMPYSFRHERKIVASLAEVPDFRKALFAINDQVRFWVYAYSSYLVNRKISLAITDGIEIPDPMPMALGGPTTDPLYREYLNEDKTEGYMNNLRQFPFILTKRRDINPWIYAKIHEYYFTPFGLIISFSLPKAAYATTFLASLFKIYEGCPIPDWVKRDEVDSKATLGTGSVSNTLEKLNFVGEICRSCGQGSVNQEEEG